MTLLTAHKIFISSAVVMCVFSAALQLWRARAGDVSLLLQGVGFAVAAIGLALYLRRLCVQPRTPRVQQ